MTGEARAVGEGLAPARASRPIVAGERVHVLGAAGAGASAAALLAQRAGAQVSGCDPGAPSPYTAAVDAAGIALAPAHDPSHIAAGGRRLVDRLGVTKALTAVDPDHPELAAAREAGVPVEAWQQLVADAAASHGGRLVAIAGTHGKSTSAGWLVHLLAAAGRDPAAFVGALLPGGPDDPPSTARWGAGDVFVVEADEYAGNFDAYRPDIAVILGAEWDHPDVFTDDEAVLTAFERWLRAPGLAGRRIVINSGDPGGARLAERLGDDALSLTTVAEDDDAADVTWLLGDGRLRIDGLPTTGGGESELVVRMPLPGRHNAANAACVAATAALVGVDAARIASGLASFGGVGRRLERMGEPAGVLVIDDYAHHPTAIRSTIAAVAETYPGRRLWAVHEPLTYHRTAAMLPELADALATADRVVVAEIWPGRDPDTTITSAAALVEAVSARMGEPALDGGTPEEAAEILAERVAPGDVVLTMGGGRSYVIAERLVERLAPRRSE